MTEQARQARNKYMREYRRAHPEEEKRRRAQYWERRAQKEKEQKVQ